MARMDMDDEELAKQYVSKQTLLSLVG